MSLLEPLERAMPQSGPLVDQFGRAHTYLRVGVTDRCNFRCTYCMPAHGIDWTHRDNLLSFEEIRRLVSVFAGMGIRRIRLTGGEPTIRRGLPILVQMLAGIEGVNDLSMTTNGHVFGKKAAEFAAAGLCRVNVSLDTLNPEQFREMTRGGELSRVLHSLDQARDAGITPIKINAVVVAGTNDDQILPMVEYFADHAATTVVRFIEYMPFGQGSRKKHLPTKVMRRKLEQRYRLDPVYDGLGGGPAVAWRIRESGLIIGFISPITEHFCHTCNRLRLTATGDLRTCLSRDRTPSLRDLMRKSTSDEELEQVIRAMVWNKVAGHEAHLDGQSFEGVMTVVGG